MSWDREGQSVSFKYLDTFPVSGKVSSSRVMYGGDVQHLVELDQPRLKSGIRFEIICWFGSLFFSSKNDLRYK